MSSDLWIHLIALCKTPPVTWSANMKQGFHEIHWIPAHDIPDDWNSNQVIELAHLVDEEILIIWNQLPEEENIIMKLFVQTETSLMCNIYKWWDIRRFVFPIFKQNIFIGWRVYERDEWTSGLKLIVNLDKMESKPLNLCEEERKKGLAESGKGVDEALRGVPSANP